MVAASSMFSQFFCPDLEPRKQTWQNHGRLRLRHRCCRRGRSKVTVKYPGSLVIYWWSMVQWYHILSHIYIYPCSIMFIHFHHVASPFCVHCGIHLPSTAVVSQPFIVLQAVTPDAKRAQAPWGAVATHWDGTFSKLGVSSCGLLVRFTQGIFGHDPLANY